MNRGWLIASAGFDCLLKSFLEQEKVQADTKVIPPTPPAQLIAFFLDVTTS
jgi:hypothetical protein